MKGVWLATMVTEHYSWTAIGKSADEAITSIVHEWNSGVGHDNRTPMTRKNLQEYYGIDCRFMEFGKCEWN